MNTNSITTKTAEYGWLYDYQTGGAIRPATEAELKASLKAAKLDGGVGAFVGADGQTVYVTGEQVGYTEEF